MTTINKTIATMFNLKGVKVKIKHFNTSERSLENRNCVPYIGKVGEIVGICEGFEKFGGKFEVKFESTKESWYFFGDLLKIMDETITLRKDLTSLDEKLRDKLRLVDVKVKTFYSSARTIESSSMVSYIGQVGKISGFCNVGAKVCFQLLGYTWEGDLLEVKVSGLKKTMKGVDVVEDTYEIAVGSPVKLINLRKGDSEYHPSASNTIGNVGTVVRGLDSRGWYRVNWNNGHSNEYRRENLEVIKEKVVEPAVDVIKVGDYVRGTKENRYGITNRNVIMEVKAVKGDSIDVKIVAANSLGSRTDTIFTGLSAKVFAKVTEEDKVEFSFQQPKKDEKIKVGDIVTGLQHNGYAITTHQAIMEVVEVNSASLGVKVIEHSSPEWKSKIGSRYFVDKSGFKKFKSGVDFSTLTE